MADLLNHLNTLQVVTGINCTKEMLKNVTSLTFLYDENWYPSNEAFTFPFVFFHMISCKETSASDVSEKRVILYETDSDIAMSTGVKKSVLSVISDNRVNRPRTYVCEVLIPFGDILTVIERVNAAATTVDSFIQSQAFQAAETGAEKLGFTSPSFNKAVAKSKKAMATVNAGLGMLKSSLRSVSDFSKVLKAIIPKTKGTLEDLNRGTGTYDYNVKSLYKMRDESSLCMFKNWNSWETKKVSIKNIIIDKKGTEDGYIRGTIELVEMPILTVAKKPIGSLVTARVATPLELAVQSAASSFIKFFQGEAK